MSRPVNPLIPTRKASDLSRREYFMAHAPAEPQPWFKPVVEAEPPNPNDLELPDDIADEVHNWNFKRQKPTSLEAIAWISKRGHVEAAHVKWAAEKNRQTYIQWPAAWADAVLASADGK